MTRSKIEPGTVIDGFVIGEQVHSGGMATLWSVTHPAIIVPLLMKIPRVSEGEDPAAIEEAARRDLGLMKPGEKLFIVKDTPRDPK